MGVCVILCTMIVLVMLVSETNAYKIFRPSLRRVAREDMAIFIPQMGWIPLIHVQFLLAGFYT